MEEIWQDIEGYEGCYQISTMGRIKSIDRYVPRKNGKLQHVHGRIMIPFDNGTGYKQVYLCKNGKTKVHYVHRLVAFHFIETQNNGSVSSLRSTTTTAVKNVFADIITRYSNSTFQTWRLYKQIGTITFADQTMSDRFNKMMAINERTIDNYEELTEDDLFYGWFEKTWTFNID